MRQSYWIVVVLKRDTSIKVPLKFYEKENVIAGLAERPSTECAREEKNCF